MSMGGHANAGLLRVRHIKYDLLTTLHKKLLHKS
jgi:hypothetical protein